MPEIGEKAPDFQLPADNETTVSLSDFLGKRVILYFYPKAMTSGWTTQAIGFRDESDQIEAANGVVIGVSPDPVERLQQFRAKNDLPFTLLSDTEHQVAELYGAWGEKKNYGKTYMGIIRSHFVIDEKGIIVDAQLKVSPQDSIEKATQCLVQLGQ
jgi:thioredoxin-dependent peroxiredoxin